MNGAKKGKSLENMILSLMIPVMGVLGAGAVSPALAQDNYVPPPEKHASAHANQDSLRAVIQEYELFGKEYKNQNDSETAIMYFEEALYIAESNKLHEETIRLHRALGGVYLIEDDEDNCLSEFKAAYELNKKSGSFESNDSFKNNYAIALANMGCSEQSIDIANEMIADNPDKSFPYSTLGQVYEINRNWEKAEVEFSKAISLAEKEGFPNREEAELNHFYRGICLLNLGRTEEGEESLKTAESFEKTN